MKIYYIHINSKQSGPFDKSELQQKGISKDTPIWYSGLSDWTTAGEIPELSDLFNAATPPPFTRKEAPRTEQQHRQQQAKTNVNLPPKKSNNSLIAIAVIAVLLIGAIGVYAVSNSNKSSNSDTYYEDVSNAGDKERVEPTSFLETDGTFTTAFIGDDYKIEGTITNTASIVTYRNITLRVTYYDEDKNEVETGYFNVDGEFPPGETNPFELRIPNVGGSTDVGWEISHANAK